MFLSYVCGGKKPTPLTVNSVVWMLLTVKKACLRRSYVNTCCCFSLPKPSGVFEKSEAKKKPKQPPHVSVQYFFITWKHGSRGSPHFLHSAPAHCWHSSFFRHVNINFSSPSSSSDWSAWEHLKDCLIVIIYEDSGKNLERYLQEKKPQDDNTDFGSQI